MEIDVTDDLDSWVDWAEAHDVSPLAIAFGKSYPQILLSGGVPDKQGPWCTPRSLVAADRYLQLLSGGPLEIVPDDQCTIEEVTGMIGSAAAQQLFAMVKLETEMPKFEKIVASPETVKIPSKPDAQMLICYHLAYRVTKDVIEPIVKYIERLPKEFAVTFMKAACRKDPSILMNQTLQKWSRENSSLMAQIAG
jgi:hypothetical protein